MKTVTHECYVSLKVAKLLKEAGFDWKCASEYTKEGNFIHILCDTREWEDGEIDWNCLTKKAAKLIGIAGWENGYSAPTLDVAQRWLREKNLLLYIPPCHIDGKWLWRYWITNCINKEDTTQIYSVKKYDTYEEALEAGIKKALEIILKKGE